MENKNLKEKNEENIKNKLNYENKIKDLEIEIKSIKEKYIKDINELKIQLNNKEKENEALKEEIKIKKINIDSEILINSDINSIIKRHKEEIKNYKNEINNKAKAIKSAMDNNVIYKKALMEKEREIYKLQKEIDNLNQEKQKLKKDK